MFFFLKMITTTIVKNNKILAAICFNMVWNVVKLHIWESLSNPRLNSSCSYHCIRSQYDGILLPCNPSSLQGIYVLCVAPSAYHNYGPVSEVYIGYEDTFTELCFQKKFPCILQPQLRSHGKFNVFNTLN